MSFLSDSSDEGAVEDLLNQAMDHSILDQIAKINCSSFSTDSVLPTHLENRFSSLKSFPVSNPKRHVGDKIVKKTEPLSLPNADCDQKLVEETESKMESRSDYFCSKSSKAMDEMGKGLIMKLASWSGSSPSNSSNSSMGSAIGSPLGEKSGERKVVKSKSRSISYDSCQSPKKAGCFWCTLKWGFRKNRKGERGIGDGENFDSNLSIFSAKKQQKLLEKVLKEEDKINREAEKIVNLVKHF